MTAVLLLSGIIGALTLWSYAATCSRLDKWLTPAGWWSRLMCTHDAELTPAADSKGRPVLECQHCGRDVALHSKPR